LESEDDVGLRAVTRRRIEAGGARGAAEGLEGVSFRVECVRVLCENVVFFSLVAVVVVREL